MSNIDSFINIAHLSRVLLTLNYTLDLIAMLALTLPESINISASVDSSDKCLTYCTVKDTRVITTYSEGNTVNTNTTFNLTKVYVTPLSNVPILVTGIFLGHVSIPSNAVELCCNGVGAHYLYLERPLADARAVVNTLTLGWLQQGMESMVSGVIRNKLKLELQNVNSVGNLGGDRFSVDSVHTHGYILTSIWDNLCLEKVTTLELYSTEFCSAHFRDVKSHLGLWCTLKTLIVCKQEDLVDIPVKYCNNVTTFKLRYPTLGIEDSILDLTQLRLKGVKKLCLGKVYSLTSVSVFTPSTVRELSVVLPIKLGYLTKSIRKVILVLDGYSGTIDMAFMELNPQVLSVEVVDKVTKVRYYISIKQRKHTSTVVNWNFSNTETTYTPFPFQF